MCFDHLKPPQNWYKNANTNMFGQKGKIMVDGQD
jgi:hypothetical protein